VAPTRRASSNLAFGTSSIPDLTFETGRVITPPTLPADSDVIVIGGGVIGIACAAELARRGRSVVVLDRDRLGHACSYGNAGWLTPSLAVPLPAPGLVWKASKWLLDPESPFYIKPRPDPGLAFWLLRFLASTGRRRFERGAAALVALARWSVDAWEALAVERPDPPFGFSRAGLLALYESPRGLAAGRAAAGLVRRFGVPSEEWTEAEVRRGEPSIHGPLLGAIHYPRDAHCEPYPAVEALATEARRAGARFFEMTEVQDLERSGGRVSRLITGRGAISGRDFILAAGSASRRLGKRFGLRLPILGAKGYTLVLPRLDPQPGRAVMLAERKVAITPHANALRISGTLELVDDDLSINRRRVDAIVKAARSFFALPDPLPPFDPWRGLRPCAPDGMPLIGRAQGHANLWLATGHQMTGLKTAPGTARLLAELMTGDTPSFDPAPFRADRY
jgi:D-amino-acid dehydrogenase